MEGYPQKKRDPKGLDLGQCVPKGGQAKDGFKSVGGNFKNVGPNRGPVTDSVHKKRG